MFASKRLRKYSLTRSRENLLVYNDRLVLNTKEHFLVEKDHVM